MFFEMLYRTQLRLTQKTTIPVEPGETVLLDVCGRVVIGGRFFSRVESELISEARSELLDTAVLLDC